MHTLCCKYDISSIFLFSPLRHRWNNGAILSALTTCLEPPPLAHSSLLGQVLDIQVGRWWISLERPHCPHHIKEAWHALLCCTQNTTTMIYGVYSKCNIIRIISPPFLLLLSVKSRIIILPSTRQSTPPSSSTRQLLDAHSLGRTWNSLNYICWTRQTITCFDLSTF